MKKYLFVVSVSAMAVLNMNAVYGMEGLVCPGAPKKALGVRPEVRGGSCSRRLFPENPICPGAPKKAPASAGNLGGPGRKLFDGKN